MPAAAHIYSTHLHSPLNNNGCRQTRSDTTLFILIGISMDEFLPIATDPALIDDLSGTDRRVAKP